MPVRDHESGHDVACARLSFVAAMRDREPATADQPECALTGTVRLPGVRTRFQDER
jgi:hypothetical protein